MRFSCSSGMSENSAKYMALDTAYALVIVPLPMVDRGRLEMRVQAASTAAMFGSQSCVWSCRSWGGVGATACGRPLSAYRCCCCCWVGGGCGGGGGGATLLCTTPNAVMCLTTGMPSPASGTSAGVLPMGSMADFLTLMRCPLAAAYMLRDAMSTATVAASMLGSSTLVSSANCWLTYRAPATMIPNVCSVRNQHPRASDRNKYSTGDNGQP